MKNENNTKTTVPPDSNTTSKDKLSASEKLDVPINEYYQLILNEYNIERDRKQSIETRSEIILSLIATFLPLYLKN